LLKNKANIKTPFFRGGDEKIFEALRQRVGRVLYSEGRIR
jgi:hypothetical protein